MLKHLKSVYSRYDELIFLEKMVDFVWNIGFFYESVTTSMIKFCYLEKLIRYLNTSL